MLYLTGNSLGEAGRPTAARDHSDHFHLGTDRPSTLTAGRYLAWWRGRQEMCRHHLRLCAGQRAAGARADHHDTLAV